MGSGSGLDLAVLPEELRLIFLLIEAEGDEKRIANNKKLFMNVDWNLFLQLAVHHRVYPILYVFLKKLDPQWIPPHVMETLHKAYYKNTFQMLYLSKEMERICRLFEENNLRLLVLKGPVLADDLYGDISLRTSVDLDIFVAINDLDKVDRFLVQQGFIKDEYFSTVLNEWKWRHHHLNYFHPQTKLKLEVHWRLSKGPGKEPSFNELWNRKRTSTLTGSSVYYLDKEDLFLYLVTHGARHGWSRIGWLVDIHKLIQQRIDLDRLYWLLKKYQRLHVGGQALILSSELLNTPTTEASTVLKLGGRSRKLAQEALFYLKQMVNLHTIPVPEDISRYHKRHLFALMSKEQKFLFVMSFFYPYPMDAETLPLPKYLHFLYVPLRPLLWAWRKTRK